MVGQIHAGTAFRALFAGGIAVWSKAAAVAKAGGGVAGKVAVAAGASAAGYTAVTAPTVKKSELPKKPPTTA